jgi:hypothetical protein
MILSTDGYVASNSLPEYKILDEIIESTIPDGTWTANLMTIDSDGTVLFYHQILITS